MLSICYQIGRKSKKITSFLGLEPGKTGYFRIFLTPTRRQVTGSKHLCLDYVIPCLPYYLSFMWYTVPTNSCYQKVITATVITGFCNFISGCWVALNFLVPLF